MTTSDDEHEQEEEAQDHAEFERLKGVVRERCGKANIQVLDVDATPDEDRAIQILMPCGREKRAVTIWDASDALAMLAFSFEDYTFLSNYDAIASYKTNTIEAAMTLAMDYPIFPRTLAVRRLFGITDGNLKDIAQERMTLAITSSVHPQAPKFTIRPASEQLRALCSLPSHSLPASIALTIENISLSQHDRAQEILEKSADSIFFQIDIKLGIPFILQRYRAKMRRSVMPRRREGEVKIEYPASRYDHEPLSLCWYARSAHHMPLLQFLAYYQATEFYFPVYSQLETKRRLQNILKSPGFSANSDTDVARLLPALRSGGGRGFADERSQLRATIQECVDPSDLRTFLSADQGRLEFYRTQAKHLSQRVLSVNKPEVDMRNEVADRLYDIRCKIVHTKTDQLGEEDLDLLLPYSKESYMLEADIDLAEYVARQVIIAGANEFVV